MAYPVVGLHVDRGDQKENLSHSEIGNLLGHVLQRKFISQRYHIYVDQLTTVGHGANQIDNME